MMFEYWMTRMRSERKVPFGTAYELFARKAWNAAIATEREACAALCDEQAEWADDRDSYNPHGKEMAERLADAMRERSNAIAQGREHSERPAGAEG